MSDHFGAPGLGGSLGICAICGKCFAREIIFGEGVTSFKANGIPQTLYVHSEPCLPLLKECAGSKWRNLPGESPLRKVFHDHEKKLALSEGK